MPPAKRTNQRLSRDCYTLTIRQTPEVGKALSGKEKDRKPVDPPPILQLQIRDLRDPAQNWLQSPYYLCIVSLWDPTEDKAPEDPTLLGTLVSSLHRLKDTDNHDAGFFVFPDLSVKSEGEFRLKFVLWELLEGEMVSLQSIISTPFRVHPAKTFPGLAESTFLTRSFSDQGVRLRIRKETRTAVKRTVAEAEGGYPESSMTSSPYGHAHHYHQPSYSVDYNLVKRQKSTGGDGWTYSHAQPSPGLYTHHSTPQGSGYYHDSVSGAPSMEYGFRSSSTTDGSVPQSYYQRSQIDTYNQTSQSLPYHTQTQPSHADISNGIRSYGDTSSYEAAALSPLVQRSNTEQPQQTYRYGVTSQNASSGQHNVLPPISTGTTSSTNSVLPSSPSYPTYASTESQYNGAANQAGRPAYGTYTGQAYQVPASYT